LDARTRCGYTAGYKRGLAGQFDKWNKQIGFGCKLITYIALYYFFILLWYSFSNIFYFHNSFKPIKNYEKRKKKKPRAPAAKLKEYAMVYNVMNTKTLNSLKIFPDMSLTLGQLLAIENMYDAYFLYLAGKSPQFASYRIPVNAETIKGWYKLFKFASCKDDWRASWGKRSVLICMNTSFIHNYFF
jgi:hypothetical protein